MPAAVSSSSPVIVLVPIGGTRPQQLEPLIPVVAQTFVAHVRLGPALRLPDLSYHPERRQYLSTRILQDLARVRRPEWERALGVADVDLYAPELSFVFGEADPGHGVAVFYMERLRAATETGDGRSLLRRRAATEAVHELGHTYGLAHCRDPRCAMWFSNSLAETDFKGERFCATHSTELSAHLGRQWPEPAIRRI